MTGGHRTRCSKNKGVACCGNLIRRVEAAPQSSWRFDFSVARQISRGSPILGTTTSTPLPSKPPMNFSAS